MSPGSIRLHTSIYSRVVAISPPTHRARFGEEQITLFGDMLQSGESPARLWWRSIPDLLSVYLDNKEEMVGHTARFALVVASIASLALAAILGWVAVDEAGDVPSSIGLAAAALLLQGGFTLLWVSGRLTRWQRIATDTMVVGEVGALLAGVLLLTSAVSTQDPLDPEFGPILVGVVTAGHAAVGLLALITSNRDSSPV